MARAKSIEAEEVVAAISEAIDTDVSADAEFATEDFLAAFGVDTDAKVSVHRHVEGQARRPWLFTFSPADTSYEEMMTVLRDDYGGGVFRIHVREGGRIIGNHAIQVEAPTPKRPDGIPSTATPEATPAVAAAGDGLASVVGEMSRMLMEGLDRIAGQTSEQFKMLLEVMKATRTDAPVVDPLAMQASILEGVARMREIAGANNETESSIELFMRALELGRSLDSKGEASPNDVLLEGLKHFAPMIASASAGPAAPPAAIPGGPERLPAPAAGEEPSAAPVQAERLTQHARMLCQVASENRDAELYGEVTLDQLGPETAKALFVDPAGLDQLARLVPEVVNFRPWFANMGGWITEIIIGLEADRRAAELAGAADPSLPHGHSGGAGGDPPDVETDGDAGRAGEGPAPDPSEGPGADGAHSPEGVSG